MINGQIVIVISPAQLDSANVTIVNLDECRELNDTLRQIVAQQDQAIKHLGQLSNEADYKISTQNRIDAEKDKQIEIYEKEAKHSKKKIKFLKFQRNILAIATAILIGFIAIHK